MDNAPKNYIDPDDRDTRPEEISNLSDHPEFKHDRQTNSDEDDIPTPENIANLPRHSRFADDDISTPENTRRLDEIHPAFRAAPPNDFDKDKVTDYAAIKARLAKDDKLLGRAAHQNERMTETVFERKVRLKAEKDGITREEAEKLLNDEAAARVRGDYSSSSKAAPSGLSDISSKEDVVSHFNKDHFTIYIKGKYKVIRENPDGSLEIMDKKDFISGFPDMKLLITPTEGGNPKLILFTEIWLESSRRRHFAYGFDFDPSFVGNRNGKYNLFKGFKVEAKEGDIAQWQTFVKDIICSGDENHFQWLDALISDMRQKPHSKPGVSVVIRGEEGIGKSFFVEKLGALFAPYYFKTSNPEYVFGNHNGQLKDKLLLHLEEAVWAGSKRDESLLKDLITGPTIEINDKYIPVYSVPNHLHLFITGNPEWLVSAGFKARRIFALHAAEALRNDTDYFKGLDNWFKNGGAEALMHHYLHHKSDINLRKVPVTDELVHQKKKSMGPVEEWLDNLIELHEMPYGEKTAESEEDHVHEGMAGKKLKCVHIRVIKKALYYDYCKSQDRLRSRVILNEKKFGRRFLELLPLVIDGVVQKHDNGVIKSVVDPNVKATDNFKTQRDAYDIPPWPVVRQAFGFNFGKQSEYDNENEWSILNDFYPNLIAWDRGR